MDVAPPTSVPAAPPAAPPAPTALQTAWPRAAQLATVFLLGVATTLLAVHAWSMLRFGARPSELERAALAARPIDLNRAGRAELMQLPGVGPALAGRIDDYRQVHGAFQSVEELRRVSGIGPKTLERIQPWVYVRAGDEEEEPGAAAMNVPPPRPASRPVSKKETALGQPIDINRAGAEELQKLPGIGPVLAQRILAERAKQPFKSVNELDRVPGIGPKTMEKLRPLVTVGNAANLVAAE